MDIDNVKQVGAWYWQTDGLEIYDCGELHHSFFHSNDDVIKMYHSDIRIEDIVVWKGENGPVVQLGWTPRDASNMHLKGVRVIHNRMGWKDTDPPKHNYCIINAARDYKNHEANNTADPSKTIRDVLLEDIESEGMNLCAMRLYALSNWYNIHIKNLTIERWNELEASAQCSLWAAVRRRRSLGGGGQ